MYIHTCRLSTLGGTRALNGRTADHNGVRQQVGENGRVQWEHMTSVVRQIVKGLLSGGRGASAPTHQHQENQSPRTQQDEREGCKHTHTPVSSKKIPQNPIRRAGGVQAHPHTGVEQKNPPEPNKTSGRGANAPTHWPILNSFNITRSTFNSHSRYWHISLSI